MSAENPTSPLLKIHETTRIPAYRIHQELFCTSVIVAMSGVEIIGLILGGLPLVITAAEDYRRGFEPLLKWHRYKREFRNFINSVDLEKQMFDGLLRRLLEFSDLSMDEKQTLLTEPDASAWAEEKTIQALRVRLGDSYPSCMFILQKMEDDMLELQKMLCLKDGSVDWVKPGEDKWNYQRKRISHSFSKKGAETIASMERNNRKFRELLDLLDTKLVAGRFNQTKAISKDTRWTAIIECVRKHATSLHSALRNGWKCNCMVPHLADLCLQERESESSSTSFTMTFSSLNSTKSASSVRKVMITVKEATSTNDQAITRPQPSPVQDWYLNKLRQNIESGEAQDGKIIPHTTSNTSSLSSRDHADVKVTKSDSVTTLSNVRAGQGTQVLVEENHRKPWRLKKTVRMNVPASLEKSCNATSTTTQITTGAGNNLDVHTLRTEESHASGAKIEDLCSVLVACSGNDSCLGYLPDQDHLYHELRSIADGTSPIINHNLISLDALLDNNTQSRFTRKQRYRLATILAASILQLQTTPWLTERLAKKNIYFYQNESGVLADQPYIRKAFTSSKILPGPTTESEALQPAFPHSTRNSLVDLGILLLELCFGQPIEKQTDLRDQYLMDGKAHNGTDFLTARDWVYAVGEEAGEEFENAVKCCVQCHFDGKLDWADMNFTQSVYAAVVEPLGKAYAKSGFA